MKDLTEKEMIYYGNFGLIEECSLCHNEYPIYNYNKYTEELNNNYIELTEKQFLCQKCK